MIRINTSSTPVSHTPNSTPRPDGMNYEELYNKAVKEHKAFNGNNEMISVGKGTGIIAVGFATGGREGRTVTLKNWSKRLPPLNGPEGTNFKTPGIAGQFYSSTVFLFNVGNGVELDDYHLSFEIKNRQGLNEIHDLTVNVHHVGCFPTKQI